MKSFEIQQDVLKGVYPPLSVASCNVNALKKATLSAFLQTAENSIVGVAPAYGPNCVLVTVALSTLSQVIVIQGLKPKPHTNSSNVLSPQKTILRDTVFCQAELLKVAFRMDKLASAMHQDLSMRVTNCKDILSISKVHRKSFGAIMSVLGNEAFEHKVSDLFKDEESHTAPIRTIALQAWLACVAGQMIGNSLKLAKIRSIDTQLFSEKELGLLSKALRDADLLSNLKPTKAKNDVKGEFSAKSGKLSLTSSRFKTRIRTCSNQVIQVETTVDGKKTTIQGRATEVKGRSAVISLEREFRGAKISSVRTLGKEADTSSEHQRADVILKTLQRDNTFLQQPFVKIIWDLEGDITFNSPIPRTNTIFTTDQRLNSSQRKAVQTILSDKEDDRVTLIVGPPGTGKTSTIAASVADITSQSERPIWLVAQSNVAVKNIAEKLALTGFLQFTLLVSQEFHYDWHEHLYEKICHNILRSDDFSDDVVGMSRLLGGSQVILCTLSMLSNNRLATIARIVPVETVIVDEASQIELGDYVPMLYRFQRTLRKLVFIGDDKQLAPYGQDDLQCLQSVFEMEHLRARAIFLDTQYRMPLPIGNFISKHVYAGRLKSVHPISAPSSCQFVDVKNGEERQRGNSWVNYREARVVISLVQRLAMRGKSYRVITPYDSQRSLIENELKSANLPWEDKCFNVDSFQGNEDDHIIISLVRSEKLGFLKESRRTNVMLTRCKKSMTICTSRDFVQSVASSSLIGQLATSQGEKTWIDYKKLLYSANSLR